MHGSLEDVLGRPKIVEASQFAGLALLVVAIWCAYTMLRAKDIMERVPIAPNPSLIWGNEQEIFENPPGHMYRQWGELLNSGAYRIKAGLGCGDILVLMDPAATSYILNKQIYNYPHSALVRPRTGRVLGKGLGWVEGAEEHRRMRHLVAPSLSQENVKAMTADVRAAGLEVVEALQQHVQADVANGVAVNMMDWLARATLNVIGRVGFLHDFQGGAAPDAAKILHGRKSGVSPVVERAGFLSLMLLRRFPVLNHLPWGPHQAHGFARQAVHEGVAHELLRRKDEVAKGADLKSNKDLLSRLLIAHNRGDISEQEVYEQISTFLIAGHETTMGTISFAVWELARHPDVQERLREEVRAFGQEPTYDDFQSRLPLLDAVLKETLRMYPTLPYMERVATKEDIIPLREPVTLTDGRVIDGIPIKPGQVINIPIIAIQRSRMWVDGDTFRPDRWLDEGGLPAREKLPTGFGNTLTFSDGPRNCIGYRLAVFKFKVILSYMITRFAFRDSKMPVVLKVAPSLQACVVGRPDLGPCLPVDLEVL